MVIERKQLKSTLELFTQEVNFSKDDAYSISMNAKSFFYPINPDISLYLCGFKLNESENKKSEEREKILAKHSKMEKYAKKKKNTPPAKPEFPEYYLSEIDKLDGYKSRSKKEQYFPCLQTILLLNESVWEALDSKSQEYTSELLDLEVTWIKVISHLNLTREEYDFSRVILDYADLAQSIITLCRVSDHEDELFASLRSIESSSNVDGNWLKMSLEDALSIASAFELKAPANLKQFKERYPTNKR